MNGYSQGFRETHILFGRLQDPSGVHCPPSPSRNANAQGTSASPKPDPSLSNGTSLDGIEQMNMLVCVSGLTKRNLTTGTVIQHRPY